MKAEVVEQLGLRQLWRKIDLAPDAPAAAREDGLGPCPISLQLSRQVQNSLQVGSRFPVPPALLSLAQGLVDQVLDQNRLLAMGSVAGRRRLKIETDCAFRAVALKPRQLPDIFAGNHFTLLVCTEMSATDFLPQKRRRRNQSVPVFRSSLL